MSAIWATAYDFPALDQGWVIREEIPDGRSSGAQGFWLNLRNERLQDPRVRQALGYLFNFEWSNETLFSGLYERTDSFWENTSMQADGLPEGAELAFLERFRDGLPETVFSEPAYVPPVSSTQSTDRQMIRRAGTLLDDAGWMVGDDGLRRNVAGGRLTIEFLNASPAFERIILPFIENMKAAGIDAVYTKVDFAQYQQRQEDFDYDIVAGRLVLPLNPSVELGTIFGSRSVDAPGSLNFSGVGNETVDAMIEGIIAADTREEMETRVRALDRVLRAMHIWVPNWYKGTHWIAYWDVFRKPEAKPPYDRGIDTWWFDQVRYDALRDAGALR